MSNTLKCGDCELYNEILKPSRKKNKPPISIHKGQCLAQSVFAKGKAGSPVYPPKAKVADLPHNRHKIVLVRESDVYTHCMHAKPRRTTHA